jgi:hypothetical protein
LLINHDSPEYQLLRSPIRRSPNHGGPQVQRIITQNEGTVGTEYARYKHEPWEIVKFTDSTGKRMIAPLVPRSFSEPHSPEPCGRPAHLNAARSPISSIEEKKEQELAFYLYWLQRANKNNDFVRGRVKETNLAALNGEIPDTSNWTLEDFDRALDIPKNPVKHQFVPASENDVVEGDVFRSQRNRVPGPLIARVHSRQVNSHLAQMATAANLKDLERKSKLADSVPPPGHYPPKLLASAIGGFIPTSKAPRGILPRKSNGGEKSLFHDIQAQANRQASRLSTKRFNHISTTDFLPEEPVEAPRLDFVAANREPDKLRHLCTREHNARSQTKLHEQRLQEALLRKQQLDQTKQDQRIYDLVRSEPGFRTKQREDGEFAEAQLLALQRWLAVVLAIRAFGSLLDHINAMRWEHKEQSAAVVIQYYFRRYRKAKRAKTLAATKALLTAFARKHVQSILQNKDHCLRMAAIETLVAFLEDQPGYRAHHVRQGFRKVVYGIRKIQFAIRANRTRKKWRFWTALIQFECERGVLALEKVKEAWIKYKDSAAFKDIKPAEGEDGILSYSPSNNNLSIYLGEGKLLESLKQMSDDDAVSEKILQILYSSKKSKIKQLPPPLRLPEFKSNWSIRMDVDRELLQEHLKHTAQKHLRARARFNDFKLKQMGGVRIPGVKLQWARTRIILIILIR